MYQELDVEAHRAASPPTINALTEIPRTLLELTGLVATYPLLAMLKRGDGHKVMVLPGFMAGDDSTVILRRYLRRMGYEPLPWTFGRNTGRPELIMEQLPARLNQVVDEAGGEKVSLIGQSLGGVYSRELARMYPDLVRQVITLGSPFATEHSDSTLPLVQRLFEQQSGMSVDEMRDLLDSLDPHVSPPVPLTAIYSKGDGIVHWQVCREAEEDAITQNIEVCGSHCGMALNPSIYYIIADRLAQPEDDWQKFSHDLLNRMTLNA